MYLRRLDGGLFTLQLVDYVMLDICATGPPSIKRRVLKILNVRNASIKTIKNVIRGTSEFVLYKLVGNFLHKRIDARHYQGGRAPKTDASNFFHQFLKCPDDLKDVCATLAGFLLEFTF